MDFQCGASVLASRGEACGVQKERLRIARHFNAGSICRWHQVPEGRPTNGHWFSRPSGTYPAPNLFPALKRRAIFRKSLRDYALFAIASILLAAIGAAAQTTNALSDVEIQGRQLAQQLLEQQPATNFTQNGVLNIRDAKGITTNIPVFFYTLVTTEHWEASYRAEQTAPIAYDRLSAYNPPSVCLRIIHRNGQPNQHLIFEDKGGIGPIEHLISPRKLQGNQIMASFAGSDFWIADLGLEFLHWPDQKILRGDTARGRLCKVLDSTNPDPSSNGYSRVDSWIDNETLGIVEAKAYDARGKLLKEFYPKDFKKVNGQWQVGSMEIDNVQTGSRTKLEFDLKAK